MDRRSFSRATLAAAVAAIAGAGHAQTAPYPSRTVKIIAPVAPAAALIWSRVRSPSGCEGARSTLHRRQHERRRWRDRGAGDDAGARRRLYADARLRRHPRYQPGVRNIPYDAVKDFTAIAMVAGTPNVLVVGSGVPAASVKELVALAKKVATSFGSAGQGSLTHLLVEQFKLAWTFGDTRAVSRHRTCDHRRAGRADAIHDAWARGSVQHIKSGKLRPLAVTGNKRHAVLPECPP